MRLIFVILLLFLSDFLLLTKTLSYLLLLSLPLLILLFLLLLLCLSSFFLFFSFNGTKVLLSFLCQLFSFLLDSFEKGCSLLLWKLLIFSCSFKFFFDVFDLVFQLTSCSKHLHEAESTSLAFLFRSCRLALSFYYSAAADHSNLRIE